MQNKTLEFVKNALLSTIPFFGAGYAAAELTDLITDSPTIITGVSTASMYVSGYASFMGLHFYDNKDHYNKDGKVQYKELAKDTGKAVLSLALAEVAYIATRSGLMHHHLSNQLPVWKATFYTEAIAAPLYYAVAVPSAKLTGFIKKQPLNKNNDTNTTC